MLDLKRIGKNILLVLLSVVISFGVMEICLRFYNPLGFRLKGDKVILPINKNEIRPHYNSLKLEKYLTIHRNSLGFRGEEPPKNFSDWLTIVTVGGSTTECRELADDKTWPEVLEGKLQGDFHSLWLNNAGLSGHSTFGHYILVQDYLVKLKPKVIIFLIGCNDMGLKDLNGADKNIIKGLTLSSFRSLERFLGAMSDYSELAAAMLNLKRYYCPKIETQITHHEIDLKTIPAMPMSEKSVSTIMQNYHQNCLGFYKIRVERLIDLVRQNNMIPVMVTQPALYGDATDPVTGVNLGIIKATTNMNGKVAWEVMEMYNDVLRKACRDQGVLLIDLARKMPKNSNYYYDLIHYTNDGARKVSEIIFADLSPYLAGKFGNFAK